MDDAELARLEQLEVDISAVASALETVDRIVAESSDGASAASEIAAVVSPGRFPLDSDPAEPLTPSTDLEQQQAGVSAASAQGVPASGEQAAGEAVAATPAPAISVPEETAAPSPEMAAPEVAAPEVAAPSPVTRATGTDVADIAVAGSDAQVDHSPMNES